MPPNLQLEDRLPGLRGADYLVTSSHDPDYNCVAWVLGETDRWWSPVPGFGSYWPPNIPRTLHISTFITLFEMQGFEVCGSAEVEPDFEKIVLFAEDGLFTHVARQLENGRWTSKLGNDVDVEHELLDLTRVRSAFPSYRYGEVAAYMRRS